MSTVTVSSKGWVVIPAEYRRKYGILPGQQVRVLDYGGVLTIVPAMNDPVEQAAGMLTGDSSLTGALLRDRAQDRSREGRRRRDKGPR